VHQVTSPLQGRVVGLPAAAGDGVRAGATLVVIESMKMEHVVAADVEGTVAAVAVAVGDAVQRGDLLVTIEPGEIAAGHGDDEAEGTGERADLAAVVDRHARGLDDARPEAVERRRPLRRRHVRGVRPAGHRRPAPPA
jgi:pyruvate/2-oxoglutarate dehydrogenase complex dihydrolipoamide acyltransferase (E2) component